MWNEIASWQEKLAHRPDLSSKTIALYTQDTRRFATWLQSEHPGLKATEVMSTDAKTYRDHLLAKLGQAAKLSSPLGPHDLRHTFAKSLLDPAAYGLDRPPMPLPAIQQLLGHADIATTTIYTRVSADDLARMMGTSESL